MECSKKNRSSYQTLKEDYEWMKADRMRQKTKSQILTHALWEIANLKSPELAKAHEIAIQALFKTDEEK